jgi:hypothetical protein
MHVGAPLSGMAITAINLRNQPAAVRQPDGHDGADRAAAWQIQSLPAATNLRRLQRLFIKG